jgi:hypothetical protein
MVERPDLGEAHPDRGAVERPGVEASSGADGDLLPVLERQLEGPLVAVRGSGGERAGALGSGVDVADQAGRLQGVGRVADPVRADAVDVHHERVVVAGDPRPALPGPRVHLLHDVLCVDEVTADRVRVPQHSPGRRLVEGVEVGNAGRCGRLRRGTTG